MRYILAMVPILVVLGLMIRLKWGAHKAGGTAWAIGLVVGFIWFGITPELIWISQAKGLLLSVFVLGVMWPALLLYHWVDRNGGVQAMTVLIEQALGNRGMCLVLLAWSLSGMLEGLAGFGLPIAVVAPMLVALKVPPVKAVAAVAVGHSWAVTFGDMGVILQTLSAVVDIPVPQLVPWAGLLMGVTCLFCGLLAAFVLGEISQWPRVLGLSVVIAVTQYGLATAGLVPLSAFGAGLAGIVAYMLVSRLFRRAPEITLSLSPPARLAVKCYGSLTLLMVLVTMVPWLHKRAHAVQWKPQFPQVASQRGFVTPAGPGQTFRPFTHPGTLTLVVVMASIAVAGKRDLPRAREAAQATVRSAGLASIGIVFMVGLSTLMDHSGMSYLLAQGLSVAFGAAYPLVSPCVGILGAFATGSNNNSNVLFGALQKNVALILHIPPAFMAAVQTAGGSLGSMLAPAKIVVGCSTVKQLGQEGQVLRQTVPLGLAMGLLLGLIALLIVHLR